MIEKMSDPNIIDYYIINCAIPSASLHASEMCIDLLLIILVILRCPVIVQVKYYQTIFIRLSIIVDYYITVMSALCK